MVRPCRPHSGTTVKGLTSSTVYYCITCVLSYYLIPYVPFPLSFRSLPRLLTAGLSVKYIGVIISGVPDTDRTRPKVQVDSQDYDTTGVPCSPRRSDDRCDRPSSSSVRSLVVCPRPSVGGSPVHLGPSCGKPFVQIYPHQ